jgi:hypothetical protein
MKRHFEQENAEEAEEERKGRMINDERERVR